MTTRNERVRGIFSAVVLLDAAFGRLTAPVVKGERHVVTALQRTGPADGAGSKAQRVVLTPGRGARGGDKVFVASMSDAEIAGELVELLREALSGLEMNKHTYLGLRTVEGGVGDRGPYDIAGPYVQVLWSAGKFLPVGALEVDVPPPLDMFTITVPVRIVESCLHDLGEGGEELALTYELDLETLPAFDEGPQKVKAEVRFNDFDLEDEDWRTTAAEHVRESATRDLQEALGIFCWHTSNQIAPKATEPTILVSGGTLTPGTLKRIQTFVRERKAGNLHSVLVIEGADVVVRKDGIWEVKVRGERVDPVAVAREAFAHIDRAQRPLRLPLALGAAAAWFRQPGNLLTVLLVLAGVVTAAWLVFR